MSAELSRLGADLPGVLVSLVEPPKINRPPGSRTMAKRIYVGLQDPRKAADVAKKTGIALSRLQQAAAGKLELSASELDKIGRVLQTR